MRLKQIHKNKPFNISGIFKVFDKPVDEISDVFDNDEAVECDINFEGPS